MFDEAALLEILIDEMPTELECPTPGCNHGVGGARWKTHPLTENNAMKMLELHIAGAQGQQHGGVGGAVRDGGGKVQLAKIPRPVVAGKYLKRKWDQYVRCSHETDEARLRDHLLNCPNEALQKAVNRALDDIVNNITLVDLLKEIETLAVVRQSNIVNTLALITAKQEKDEPIRQCPARLCGLAAVCNLTITCTCLLKVDKCVRMFLVCGLNDEDTKQAVLSKVDEMTTLDDTIAFIGSQGVRERNQRRFGKMQTLWEERPSEKSVH